MTFSQSEYSFGYIISLENDTIYGSIKNDDYSSSPKEVTVKQSDIITFNPSEIKGFFVNNSYYQSSICHLYKSEKDTLITSVSTDGVFVGSYYYETSITKKQVSEKDTAFFSTGQFNKIETAVFLRRIISGNLSLYTTIDNTGKELFFLYKNVYQDLLEKNNIFKNQLKSQMYDCKNLLSKIDSIDYSESDLKNIVYEYNKYIKSDAFQQNSKQKVDYYFGLLFGTEYIRLNFISDFDYYDFEGLTRSKLSFSPEFVFGCSLLKEHLNLSIGADYFKYYELLDYDDSYILFDFKYIRVNFAAKYVFKTKNINLFIGGGINNALSLKNDNYIYSKSLEKKIPIWDTYEKSSIGINLITGINYKRFIIQYKFYRASGIKNVTSIKSNYTSNTLSLGIILHKGKF